jgi:hypothetical protein
MASPAKRRKLKDTSKSSPAGSRNLDFFFGKQKKDAPAGEGRIVDLPQHSKDDASGLSDEQLARKLQAQWDDEAAGHLMVPTESDQQQKRPLDGLSATSVKASGSAEDVEGRGANGAKNIFTSKDGKVDERIGTFRGTQSVEGTENLGAQDEFRGKEDLGSMNVGRDQLTDTRNSSISGQEKVDGESETLDGSGNPFKSHSKNEQVDISILAPKNVFTSLGPKNNLSLQSTGSAEDEISSKIPFDESPLTFDPQKYVPDLQKHWAAEDGNASYALLTRCFVLVNSTQSRIKIVDTLVNLLRTLIEGDPTSLLPTVCIQTTCPETHTTSYF